MNTQKLHSSTHRKKMDTSGDPYIVKTRNNHMAVCTKCHTVYFNKRWYIDEDLYQKKILMKKIEKVLCPACRKIKDNFPGGIVRLRGAFLNDHKDEIINLIRNEEERARGFNPLERIIKITDVKNELEITTTNEKLAQRIGKSMQKAYQGKVKYKWSDDTKLLRADWER
jgi:NMD protein affecting ribosome stability and mRNA decay